MVWSISNQHSYRTRYTEYATGQSAENARKEIETVCSRETTPSGYVECTERVLGSERDNRRSDYDLEAQQDMAQWAFVLVAITAGQAIIGGVGLYLLIGTFRQTAIQAHAAQRAVASNLRANIIARDAYAANERPWIRLKVLSVGPIDLRFDSAHATVEVENVGKTPALDVRVVMFPAIVRSIQPDKTHIERYVGRALRNAPDNRMSSVVAFPNDPIAFNIPNDHFEELDLPNQFNKGKVGVVIVFVCTYRSNLTSEYWHTCLTVRVRRKTSTGTVPFDIDGPPQAIEDLTFESNNRLTSVS